MSVSTSLCLSPSPSPPLSLSPPPPSLSHTHPLTQCTHTDMRVPHTLQAERIPGSLFFDIDAISDTASSVSEPRTLLIAWPWIGCDMQSPHRRYLHSHRHLSTHSPPHPLPPPPLFALLSFPPHCFPSSPTCCLLPLPLLLPCLPWAYQTLTPSWCTMARGYSVRPERGGECVP